MGLLHREEHPFAATSFKKGDGRILRDYERRKGGGEKKMKGREKETKKEEERAKGCSGPHVCIFVTIVQVTHINWEGCVCGAICNVL